MPLEMPGYQMPILLHPGAKVFILLQKTMDLNGVVVTSTIQGENIEYLTNARKYVAPLSINPIPVSDAKEQIKLHSFLSLEDIKLLIEAKSITLKTNNPLLKCKNFIKRQGKMISGKRKSM